MKRFILSVCLLLGIAGFASAQTTKKTTTKATTAKAKKSNKKQVAKKTSTKKQVPVDNTKMYKKDGQAATPTGHEATGINSGYSALKKDSAAAPGKDTSNKRDQKK